jgi:hypothetical protein
MAGTGPMYLVCEELGTPVTSGCGTGYQGTLVHAPNENIRIADYWAAMRSWARLSRPLRRRRYALDTPQLLKYPYHQDS